MAKFRIAETKKFEKAIEQNHYQPIYIKITEHIYPILRQNPYFGTNIKHLKGNIKALYRYRTGNYRLFYTIDEVEKIVFILNFTDRKDAYFTR